MQGLAEACVGREMVEAVRRAELTTRERVRAAFRVRLRRRSRGGHRDKAEGDPAALLARAARTTDLVVTGRGGAGGPRRGGRPPRTARHRCRRAEVLVLPPRVPVGGIGGTVLVAWNGSREAARAAHDALPFLASGTDRVVLCAVGEEAGASLDDAAAMLGADTACRCGPSGSTGRTPTRARSCSTRAAERGGPCW